jgi:VWFA-related protein
VPRDFIVIFYKPGNQAPYEVWRPGRSVRPIQRSALPTTDIRLLCAEELLNYASAFISQTPSYDRLLDQAVTLPQPPSEWLATFAATLTDVPEDAETFVATLEVRHPVRNQSRTAVEAIVRVPLAEAPGRVFGDQRFHSFVLTGEVLEGGALFESFRYTFEGPTPEIGGAIPLGFTRFLRPGAWTLRLLLEDTLSARFAQFVQQVEVPSPEGLPQVERDALSVLTTRPKTIDLLTPSGSVLSGLVRFAARTAEQVDRVAFFIDDRQVLAKGRPPFSAELDLGESPRPMRVRAVAFVAGEEVGSDQVWLNQGAQRLAVRLIEPRPGGIYPGAVPIRVELTVPGGQAAARVELYQDDRRLGALEPPYAGSVQLAGDGRPTVVRVVATLADGSTAEDAVLVNTAGLQEELRVSLVTVPVVVLGDDGSPLAGLAPELFELRVAGERVPIRSVEAASDAPLRVAMLLDRSISMRDSLPIVRQAAIRFVEQAIVTAEDRLALFSFADQGRLEVGWTASQPELERGLAGLVAFGGTALIDGMIQAVNSIDDADRAGAVLVFTDGQDENSVAAPTELQRLLESSATSLYIIGLQEGFPERRAREQLEELAALTGGRLVLVADASELSTVYAGILEELRARYLITFEPVAGEQDRLVPITVRLDRPGVVVRARAGYRP